MLDMSARTSFDELQAGRDKKLYERSSRRRINAFHLNPKQPEALLSDDDEQRHRQTTSARAEDMGLPTSTTPACSRIGVSRIGYRIIGSLAMLALFLLLSSGANRYEYTLSPSYLSSSPASAYKAAKISLDEALARCAMTATHQIACKVQYAAELESQLVSRQSRTPGQAVLAYKRRYSRSPPRGFEAWVKFALDHNVTVIDDYDQIEVDLDAFRQAGLVGDRLKSRMLEAKLQLPGVELGQLSVLDGQVVVLGPELGPLSATTLIDLLEPVQHLIPDTTILFNWFAEPRMPHTAERASSGLVRSMDFAGKDPSSVLRNACPSNHLTPKRAWDSLQAPLDYCSEDQQELSELHGFLKSPSNFLPLNKLVPMLSRSKLSNFADILAPNVCYGHPMYRGLVDVRPWEEKSNTVYWRGTTTGETQTPTTWARGHRHRMLRYVKQLREAANKLTKGVEMDPLDEIYAANRTVLPSRDSVDLAGNTLPPFDYTDRNVVKAIERLGYSTFNVTWSQFVHADQPTLASLMENQVTSGTEERNDVYKHKYVLDLDGESMSCRFYQLLGSNSVVLKQTLWSEYHDDRLIPWIHYVPLDLRVENNELPMLIDFFNNHPQGSATAAKIAAASRAWTETTLRPIDVALYYARLLIEYAELYNPSF